MIYIPAFKDKDEMIAYLNENNSSKELFKNAIEAMNGTIECNKIHDVSLVIFAANVKEQESIEEEFGLSRLTPELEEIIFNKGVPEWKRNLYIFGNSGDGYVYYEKILHIIDKAK